jgi:COP9 signalosome complex subunit 2
MILEMKATCKLPGASVHDNSKSTFDESKGNTLLEIFALEIQAYTIRKETKKMRALYHLSENFTGVIDDPRVLAIIKESGAKMYMSEKRWELAMEAFFNAFCRAVECGSGNATTLLKYVLFAAMLAQSEVDYLMTQEAKVYASDPQIEGMKNLQEGFKKNDIKLIMRELNDTKLNLMGDKLF